MNKKDAQDAFQKDYTPSGVIIPKPMTKEVLENKHGIDNVVTDLNVRPQSLESLPNNTYLGNTSGATGPATSQNLGVSAHFYTKDGKGVTVTLGLVTLVTTTSTSSSSSSSSSISSSSSSLSSSSSSSSVSTSSSSSSSSSISETTSSSSSSSSTT